MKHPIVLTVFASGGNLNTREEERAIANALTNLHDARRIELYLQSEVTLDEVYRLFHRFYNRIIIFHFGGHSDQTYLKTTVQHCRAENLSRVMGMQRKLRLVVLNGCKNYNQVKEYVNQGVRAVIATNANINDSSAIIFAQHFYEALASDNSIKDAFEAACVRVKESNVDIQFQVLPVRGGGVLSASHTEWILYYQNEEDFNWTMPNEHFDTREGDDYSAEVVFNADEIDFNKELVRPIFNGIMKYNSGHKAIWHEYKEGHKGIKDLQTIIKMVYPSSVSIQIKDLFADETYIRGRKRLKDLNQVFLNLMKLLTAISLADLWHAAVDKRTLQPLTDFKIRSEYRRDLEQFYFQWYTNSSEVDYGWLMGAIRHIFEDNGRQPFIVESDELLLCFSKFNNNYESYKFLEDNLRKRLLRNDIEKDEVLELCLDVEDHLGQLLGACAFLTTYKIVRIRDILVSNQLTENIPQFIHKSIVLEGDGYGKVKNEPITRTSFTYNNSVILIEDVNTSDEMLNLSPFLIDENTFKVNGSKLPKICFFKGWSKEGGIVYELAETLERHFEISDTMKRAVYKSDLSVIKEQLKNFKTDLQLNPTNDI